MAAWSSRTVTVTRHEWEIPAAQPWGACLGDIRSAIEAAAAVYRQKHGLNETVALPDTALHFHVIDDAIRISFTVETPQ